MKILALDCSTEACSVALYQQAAEGAEPEVIEQFEHCARQHTERILPMVHSLLADTETSLQHIDALAFGRGPGSFTGLRICTGAVQGLALGAGLPVVAVSSLAALAQTAVQSSQLVLPATADLLATFDARMDEIYWACYRLENGVLQSLGEERLSAPEQVIVPAGNRPVAALGSGWSYSERIPGAGSVTIADATLLPGASAVATLASTAYQQGGALPAEQAIPVYLRDTVAWQKQGM